MGITGACYPDRKASVEYDREKNAPALLFDSLEAYAMQVADAAFRVSAMVEERVEKRLGGVPTECNPNEKAGVPSSPSTCRSIEIRLESISHNLEKIKSAIERL